MRRYLDPYEVAHLGAPTAFVVDCVGRLDDSALAAAFDLLCVQHPALRGHVRHDGHGHVLDTRHGHHAIFRSQPVHDYPRDVTTEWDVTRSLATLTVNRAKGRVRVALYLDHCVGDGRHMRALCESLWRLYTDIATGAKLTVAPARRLPSPPLKVLASRIGAGHDGVTATTPVDATLPVLRYRRVELTETETQSLIETVRAREVTVYAFLVASVAHVQRATTIWAVVDLRDRVEPPVGPTDTTNFASAATLDLDPSDDLLTTAKKARAQVLAAIASNMPRENMRDNSVGRDMGTPRGSLSAAIVSNLGGVPSFATPPRLEITGFRIWPYGWSHPFPMYMASTYRGRLGVDMVFRADVHSDEAADLMAAGMRTIMSRT